MNLQAWEGYKNGVLLSILFTNNIHRIFIFVCGGSKNKTV